MQGRAGMLGACTLLCAGEARSAREAIAIVRKRRCAQAIETRRQEEFGAVPSSRLHAPLPLLPTCCLGVADSLAACVRHVRVSRTLWHRPPPESFPT